MAVRRRLVALSDAQLSAVRGACHSAIAGGSGGDFTASDLRSIEAALPALQEAPLVDVVVGLTAAQASALLGACTERALSLADQYSDPGIPTESRTLERATGALVAGIKGRR